MSDNRHHALAIGAAIAAGVIAATVTYLFATRPHWRRHVVDVGHHALNLAEGMLRHRKALE